MQSGNLTTGKELAANFVNGIIMVIQNSLILAYTLGELKEYTADKIRRPKTKKKEAQEQLEIIKGRIDSSEKVNAEIENIKQCISADSLDFSEYNDVTIRRLVEYIQVMKDNLIIIVLKGGMQIQESI